MDLDLFDDILDVLYQKLEDTKLGYKETLARQDGSTPILFQEDIMEELEYFRGAQWGLQYGIDYVQSVIEIANKRRLHGSKNT